MRSSSTTIRAREDGLRPHCPATTTRRTGFRFRCASAALPTAEAVAEDAERESHSHDERGRLARLTFREAISVWISDRQAIHHFIQGVGDLVSGLSERFGFLQPVESAHVQLRLLIDRNVLPNGCGQCLRVNGEIVEYPVRNISGKKLVGCQEGRLRKSAQTTPMHKLLRGCFLDILINELEQFKRVLDRSCRDHQFTYVRALARVTCIQDPVDRNPARYAYREQAHDHAEDRHPGRGIAAEADVHAPKGALSLGWAA